MEYCEVRLPRGVVELLLKNCEQGKAITAKARETIENHIEAREVAELEEKYGTAVQVFQEALERRKWPTEPF